MWGGIKTLTVTGRMVAVMIALDDITAENAPSVFIPGSHRNSAGVPYLVPHDQEPNPTETLSYYNIISEKALEPLFGSPLAPELCLLAKGEFAIFDSYLVHGVGRTTPTAGVQQ